MSGLLDRLGFGLAGAALFGIAHVMFGVPADIWQVPALLICWAVMAFVHSDRMARDLARTLSDVRPKARRKPRGKK